MPIATAVPIAVDRSKFDFRTALAWRLKPSRASEQAAELDCYIINALQKEEKTLKVN